MRASLPLLHPAAVAVSSRLTSSVVVLLGRACALQEARLLSLEQREGRAPGSNPAMDALLRGFPGLTAAMGLPTTTTVPPSLAGGSGPVGVTTQPPPVPTFIHGPGGTMRALRRPSAGSGLTAVDSLGFGMLTSTGIDFDFNADDGP